jgi:hypothetical protein
LKKTQSEYPLRDIGTNLEAGTFWLSEEERADHLHILGTTGEGKSRFIELLIRGDIQNGNGVCFLDPSENGDTMYRILRYCASIGFEKVCLIDPHQRPLACIQPFDKKYKAASVANVDSTIRTVFQTKDAAETTRINRYLPALLRVLWSSGMTLRESVYFSDYENAGYKARRMEILSRLDIDDRDRVMLEGVFKNYPRFEQYFSSTVNRLEPYWDSTLALMFGADKGVDFIKMITEGWVILVSLYSGLGFEPLQTRLLGTTVINEVIHALDRLGKRGWKGVYYLYIDEAGRYANRNLADLLAYKRKSGLRLAIAHQYFKQFDDPFVLEAVKNLTKIKVMFNTPNPTDRLEMVKLLGYGGNIPRLEAEYANKDIPKQYAVIKKGKTPPVRVRIKDVPDPLNVWDKKAKTEFIKKILSNEWNLTSDEIRDQIKKRFNDDQAKRDSKSPRKGTKANKRASVKTVFD